MARSVYLDHWRLAAATLPPFLICKPQNNFGSRCPNYAVSRFRPVVLTCRPVATIIKAQFQTQDTMQTQMGRTAWQAAAFSILDRKGRMRREGKHRRQKMLKTPFLRRTGESCGKYFFGGATWAGGKNSPTTVESRSMRSRTSPESCCRISSPTTKARKVSVNLRNGRRRGTRQKRTRTAMTRTPPDDRYKTNPRDICS